MALFRALETVRRTDSLFEDVSAIRFLPFPWRLLVAAARLPAVGRLLEHILDVRWPGARSSGVARTRLIDDWITDAVAAGAQQVVFLGAGFDCRALRLSALAAVPVFEVDRPALLADKRRRLRATGVEGRARLVDVPIDFQSGDLGACLSAAGLKRDACTLFVWEGVSNYLDADAVAGVFDLVARFGTGRIVFTYIHADVLNGRFAAPGLKVLSRYLAASGESWTFGFRPDELGDYLTGHGLHLVRDIGAADYRRAVMGKRSRGLVGYEFYHVALADVGEGMTKADA